MNGGMKEDDLRSRLQRGKRKKKKQSEQVHADRRLTCALIAKAEYGLIVDTCIGARLPGEARLMLDVRLKIDRNTEAAERNSKYDS